MKSAESPAESSRTADTELEDAIELSGIGKYQMGLMVICGSCLMTMVNETMGISFVLPAAQCDLALTTADKGYLSGATYLGMLVSAYVWGFSADMIGRKKVLLVSLYGTWIASFLSSLAPNVWSFIVLRFLTGLFLCGLSSIVYAYLSEFLPAKSRTRFMTWTCIFMGFGFLMIPSMAWIILPRNINWQMGVIVFKPWRLYIMVMGIFSLINGLIFPRLSESPKFLMSTGKKQEALEVLRDIYATNSGKSRAEYPVTNLAYGIYDHESGESNMYASNEQKNRKATYRRVLHMIWRQTYPLFLPPYGWRTLIFCTLQFGLYVVGAGLYNWIPTILNSVMFNTNGLSSTICDLVSHKETQTHSSNATNSVSTECIDEIRMEVYMSSLIIGCSYIICFIILGFVLAVINKRALLVMLMTLSAAAGIGVYFASNVILSMVLLNSFTVLAGTSTGVVSATLIDLYPTTYRGMAVVLALTSGRLGSATAGYTIGFLIEANCDFTFIGTGCMILFCAILCHFNPKAKKEEVE